MTVVPVAEESWPTHALEEPGLAVETADGILVTHLTALKTAVEACNRITTLVLSGRH